MNKSPFKKVAAKKLIGLTAEALLELERQAEERCITMTQVIHDALLQTVKHFDPHVESGIKAYQKRHHCSRLAALEGLLANAIKRLKL